MEEEYYRALSLTKSKKEPAILIPVILRKVDPLPGFVKSRNWVDFRDEMVYAQKVWELVWGITGQKPAAVIDVSSPPTAPAPAAKKVAPAAKAQPKAPAGTGFRSGSIKARNIKADKLVVGVQLQGGDAEMARAALELTKNFQSGDIEATEDITAKNFVVGFQYLGQGGSEPDREQFRRELAALQKRLDEAIAAGEILDPYEAEDAQTALKRAAEQATAEQPEKEKLAVQLDRATNILTTAGETAVAAGKFGLKIIKLAPVAAGLKLLAERLF